LIKQHRYDRSSSNLFAGLTGIAFAPHVPPAGSSQETLHPIQPPGTMQAVVSPDMKTTLTAGIVPTNIELLLSSKTALQIDRVDTMPQVTIVSLRLPRKIYEAHIARLKRTAGEIWKQHKVRVHIKEPKVFSNARPFHMPLRNIADLYSFVLAGDGWCL
jgi:hypothetical protein